MVAEWLKLVKFVCFFRFTTSKKPSAAASPQTLFWTISRILPIIYFYLIIVTMFTLLTLNYGLTLNSNPE